MLWVAPLRGHSVSMSFVPPPDWRKEESGICGSPSGLEGELGVNMAKPGVDEVWSKYWALGPRNKLRSYLCVTGKCLGNVEQVSTWACVTEWTVWVSSPLHCSGSLWSRTEQKHTIDLAEETYAGILNCPGCWELICWGDRITSTSGMTLFVTLWAPSLKRLRDTLGTNLLMFTIQGSCFGGRRGEIKNSFSCPGWCRSAS